MLQQSDRLVQRIDHVIQCKYRGEIQIATVLVITQIQMTMVTVLPTAMIASLWIVQSPATAMATA